MTPARRWLIGAVVLGVAAGLPGQARAGVYRNVGWWLWLTGWDVVGVPNPLSGGAEVRISNDFNGQTLDFGATELTLDGPISLMFETGGRLLPVMDFSLSTLGQPVQYVLESSTGAQDVIAQGTFLMDATGTINTFGFYNLRLQLSNREDLSLEGRFQDGVEQELDFDIGPVDVSGNIFSDLLAVILNPVFAALGVDNVFASFSGALESEELMQLLIADSQAKLAGWDNLTARELAGITGYGEGVSPWARNGLSTSRVGGISGDGTISFAPVPEPGILAFLLGPTAYLLLRRSRRG